MRERGVTTLVRFTAGLCPAFFLLAHQGARRFERLQPEVTVHAALAGASLFFGDLHVSSGW